MQLNLERQVQPFFEEMCEVYYCRVSMGMSYTDPDFGKLID